MSGSVEASTMPLVNVKDRIDLTATEEKIFHLLMQVRNHFGLKTELRVAGGWVRDKLLGKECIDIDIALDDMLGREFCEKLNEYLSFIGEEAQGLHVIRCNPERSKHLETASMHLFGVKIDFINLRSEGYHEYSRIPTMKFGTAEQDAYRRDLSINSLFYNINTSSVEDFTKRGISDLKSGSIATPLLPKETFLDDPLRVLRAIRFGARFGFVLDEKLKIAAADNDVKATISKKISRERIHDEINLMLSGNNPVMAMTYILELQLFSIVFSLPPETEPPIVEGWERLCAATMDQCWNLLQLARLSSLTEPTSNKVITDRDATRSSLKDKSKDGQERHQRLCLYASLLLPLRDTVYRDKKGGKVPVVSYILQTSLKFSDADTTQVKALHLAVKKFVSLIPLIEFKENLQTVEVSWKNDTIDVPVSLKLQILAEKSKSFGGLLCCFLCCYTLIILRMQN